ncbi:iron-sulfur (Fe-S) cluster assembly protein [Babesia ovata]|uniref:Iron-sulfur (Fe-S) cluster assembly protein n=1 Tax=Babesia ovata TaxID=189622 RepID=A0A2H6K763_9APIC|nr:iron-sulfur (Fe-S) cluster assembly protein [Babesia ovata]GBE58831.1 iron-sulfur (Fe-S) cluster assembly protein [Babesia ovata]
MPSVGFVRYATPVGLQLHTTAAHIAAAGKIVKLMFVVKGCNGYSYEMELVDISSLDAMDEIVRDQAGEPVLAIENKAAFHLLGCNIDYQVSQLEEGFVFDNPNVTSKCGCGQSFQF